MTVYQAYAVILLINMTNIEKIYKEDQIDRRNISASNFEILIKRDAGRRKKVSSMITRGALKQGKDFYLAAIIFQHGLTKKDYEMAIKLAKMAVAAGYKKGKYIEALATDRLLMISGKRQKFGTQFFRKNPRSKFIMYPVSKKTTDLERKEYGLPPLSVLEKRVDKLNAR